MKFKTIILTALGTILLILGAIGIFLPVLPTTPFVIMAVACFGGTPKLQSKIISAPFFKEHIDNYKTRQGISRNIVIVSLLFLWSSLILSIILAGKPWLTLLLTAIGTAVTIHILWMSRPKNKVKSTIMSKEIL